MNPEPGPLDLKLGGAVNPRKYVYIVRPSDDEVFRLLEAGEYCNVLCSRQMGKTSLLLRTKTRLAEAGVKSAQVDLAGYFGTMPPESADEWYKDLLLEITSQLDLDIDVVGWWGSQASATPNRKLIAFFRDEVAARAGAPVVIIVDEIDSTLKLPYTDDFFVAIRAMYNDRPREPAFERVTFCLVGVATPNELIKGPRTTPYNVGRTIALRDFDPGRDDLAPLYRAVGGDDAVKGEALVRAVLRWTGGQPYLTMNLCEEAARRGAAGPEDVDRFVAGSYPSLEALRDDVHFAEVLKFVAMRVDDRLTALTLYRRIHRGRREPDQTTPAHIALKLSGLVRRGDDGRLAVRNAIYRRVFNARWAAEAMPDTGRALRNARRLTVAASLLFLATAGVWYEAIYPWQLTNRLNAAIAEDRYAVDTYQLLRGVPFYSARADRLWAGLFERRAGRAASQGDPEVALLWWLKASSVRPSRVDYREAASRLIEGDFAGLMSTRRRWLTSSGTVVPPSPLEAGFCHVQRSVTMDRPQPRREASGRGWPQFIAGLGPGTLGRRPGNGPGRPSLAACLLGLRLAASRPRIELRRGRAGRGREGRWP